MTELTLGTPRVPVRSGWTALVVTVAARAVLAVLVSLLGWSMAPALFGWTPTVVMTGSMQPKLIPGDIVISRPIDTSQLALGQVLLVDSPDRRGELRLHRLVRFGADGTLILRGDANHAPDSSPVSRSAVRGVGALHIPYLGRPYLWAADGQFGPLALAVLGLGAVLALAFWWRPAPSAPAEDEPPRGAAVDDTPAAPEPAVPAAVGHRRVTRTLLVGVLAAVLVAVTTSGADAATAFTAKATNPTNTWAASTWFTCANAVKGNGAAFALPLSESSGTTAADVSGNNVNGSYGTSGVTYGVTGPCLHDNRTAVTLDGTAGQVTAGSCPGGSTLSYEIWFKAPSSSHGGGLMSATKNNGTQAQIALAMTSTGKITFAAGSSASSVTTTASYNDNTWHLAVATMSSSTIALYVDNQSPVTRAASTNVSATKLNIGFDQHNDLGTGSFDYFPGSIAFAAVYTTTLTAGQIAAHYAAT